MSRATTTVKQILTAMAYNRETFKDRAEEKIGGALLEYYKATLAERSGQTARRVEHWKTEAERLIDIELAVVLLHSIKGFRDRRKPVQEVIQHLQEIDHQYRRAAERTVKHDYGLKKLRSHITDADTDDFYEMVRRVIETHT